MALGLATLLGLGFVVAVAARSRPGGADDPMFELDTRLDVDLGNLLGWVVFITAILGAVLLVYGIKEAKPRREERKRNYVGLILGIIVFFLIARYFRPVAEALLGPDAASQAEEGAGELERTGGGAAGWLFSILVAAVVAAALTRVGLTVRKSEASFDIDEPTPAEPVGGARQARPADLDLGIGPRARVLRAYDHFERGAAEAGLPRLPTETAGRHARKVAGERSLDKSAVDGLMSCFSRARFGMAPVDEEDAGLAENLSNRLLGEMARWSV